MKNKDLLKRAKEDDVRFRSPISPLRTGRSRVYMRPSAVSRRAMARRRVLFGRFLGVELARIQESDASHRGSG